MVSTGLMILQIAQEFDKRFLTFAANDVIDMRRRQQRFRHGRSVGAAHDDDGARALSLPAPRLREPRESTA